MAALPGAALRAVIYKELLSLARRFIGLVLLMQLALLFTLMMNQGDSEAITAGFPWIVCFSSLWGATLLSGGALSDEREAVRMEALSLFGVRPRALVFGKFLSLWLLSLLIPLSAALPLVAAAVLRSPQLDTVAWAVAVQPFAVAFSIAASAEPTRMFRTFGWGLGLWLGGLLAAGFVEGELRGDAGLMVAVTLALATPAALALALDRIGGAPLVGLKRLCGLLALGIPLWLPTHDLRPLAWGLSFLMALDALTEPLDAPAGRIGRWLRHPLAAVLYPPLLMVVGAALYLRAYPGDAEEVSAVAVYLLFLVGPAAIVGRLARRFVHPLLSGLGISSLGVILVSSLISFSPWDLHIHRGASLALSLLGACLYLVAGAMRWWGARRLVRAAGDSAPPDTPAAPAPKAATLAQDSLPERWPAVLVKEITQLMRGPIFLLVFLSCLLFQLFLLIPLSSGELGAAALPVEAGAVLLAATGLSSERKGGKLDFLLLAQTPSRLVWGKWAAVAMLQLMLFSLGLPILIAAYLAAHADLLSLLPVRLFGLGVSVCAATIALWMSSVSNRVLQAGLAGLGAWALIGGLTTFGFTRASVSELLTGLIAAAILCAAFLELAADQLSPLPSAPTTRRKRLLGLLGLLAAAAMIALGARHRESIFAVLLLPAVMMLDALWDAPGEGRPSRPLAPGQRSALGYAAIVSLSAALLYGLGSRHYAGPGVALISFLQLIFWVLISGAARRLLSLPREWMPLVVLGLGLAQALFMAIPEFTRDVFPAGVLIVPAGRLSGDRVVAWGLSLGLGLVFAGTLFSVSTPPPRPEEPER